MKAAEERRGGIGCTGRATQPSRIVHAHARAHTHMRAHSAYRARLPLPRMLTRNLSLSARSPASSQPVESIGGVEEDSFLILLYCLTEIVFPPPSSIIVVPDSLYSLFFPFFPPYKRLSFPFFLFIFLSELIYDLLLELLRFQPSKFLFRGVRRDCACVQG